MSSPLNPESRRLLRDINEIRVSLLAESLPETRRAELTGRIAEYALVSLVVLGIAGMEVGRWYFQSPPQPRWVCFFALCIVGYAAVRVWMILPQLRVLLREREAHRHLKAAIEALCARGYVLFDNLRDPSGPPLGSVIVGPSGVFSLVARFLPRSHNLSECVRHVDADTVVVGGHDVLADPIGRARMFSAAVYGLLGRSGLETVEVHPLVVFPGWTIERAPAAAEGDVRVVSEQTLEEEIRGTEGEPLSPADIIAVSMLLEPLQQSVVVRGLH